MQKLGGSFLAPSIGFLGLLTLCPVNSLAGGAWVHEANKYYVETSFSYYQANEIFRSDGTRVPNRIVKDPTNPASVFAGLVDNTYRQYEGSLYLEYGLPYDLEFSASFPFYRSSQQDSDIGKFEASGIGDSIVGLKYKWFERPWLLSAFQVEVGIPSGDEKAHGSVAGQVDHQVPLGDGEWDVAFKLYASHSFYPVPAYVSVDFGYRVRNSGGGVQYDDDLPWAVEGGYTFDFHRNWFSGLTSFLTFRGLKNTGTPKVTGFAGLEASGNTPDQEFVDVQPGISLGIWKKLSWINVFSYTLAGENTGAGWGIRSGLSFEN